MHIISYRYKPIRIYVVAIKQTDSDTPNTYRVTADYFSLSKKAGIFRFGRFDEWTRYGKLKLSHSHNIMYFTDKKDAVKTILKGDIHGPDVIVYDKYDPQNQYTKKYYMQHATLFIEQHLNNKLVSLQKIKFIPLRMTIDKQKIIFPKKAKFTY